MFLTAHLLVAQRAEHRGRTEDSGALATARAVLDLFENPPPTLPSVPRLELDHLEMARQAFLMGSFLQDPPGVSITSQPVPIGFRGAGAEDRTQPDGWMAQGHPKWGRAKVR